MRIKKILFTFSLLYFFCIITQAQLVQQITPEQYNAGKQNWSIIEYKDCIIVSNDQKIMIFDGIRWKYLPLPNGQVVRSMAIKGDKLYCVGYKSFGYWNMLDNQFIYTDLTHLIHNKESEYGEEYWQILAWNQGVVFQSFAYHYFYDGKKVVQLPKLNTPKLINTSHQELLSTSVNGIHIQTTLTNTKVIYNLSQLNHKAPYWATEIDGKYLSCTEYQGVQILDGKDISPLSKPINDKLKKYGFQKLQKLTNSQLLWITKTNGIYITNYNGDIIHSFNEENGLINNSVLCSYQDKYENIWIGCNGGLSILNLNTPFKMVLFKDNTYGTISTISMYKGEYFIGTNLGLFHKTPSETKYNKIPGINSHVINTSTIDNKLYIGLNSGSYVYDGVTTKKLSSISGSGKIKKISINNKNYLLQANYSNIALYHEVSPSNYQFLKQLSDDYLPILDFVWDRKNTLLGTHYYDGFFVIKIDWKTLSISKSMFITKLNQSINLAHLRILEIKEKIYLSNQSQEFFEITDWKNIKLQKINTSKNLIDFYYTHNFWVDRYKDYIQIRKESVDYKIPLFSSTQSTNILSIQNTNKIIIPQNSGYIEIDSFYPIFPTIKSELRLSAYYTKNDKSDLQLHSSKKINLSADQRNLHLQFAYPNMFDNCNKLIFEWEDKKLELNKDMELTLDNLPSGNNTLLAKNSDQSILYKIDITVEKYYYESWLFRMFVIILLGLLAYNLQKWHKARLKKQEINLIAIQQKKDQQRKILQKNKDLETTLQHKNEQLSNYAMTVIKKNEILLELKNSIEQLENKPNNNTQINKIIKVVDVNLENEDDWKIFENNFTAVHKDFLQKLLNEYQNLSSGDLKLAAFIKMQLSSKEIAPLLNITVRSIENRRYRLRKKLNLHHNDNLSDFLLKY